jgi:uncharacterized membrane protein
MTARTRRSARLEALVWIAGILLVALPDPDSGRLFSVCPLGHLGDLLGHALCPGCGLGRSVAWLVRGEVAASLAMHPLGIPAVGILLHHAVSLWRGPAYRPALQDH